MTGARAKEAEVYPGKTHFQYLVAVYDNAERSCPAVWPGGNQRLHWSFEDLAAFVGSYAERFKKFREVRDQIGCKVLERLKGV